MSIKDRVLERLAEASGGTIQGYDRGPSRAYVRIPKGKVGDVARTLIEFGARLSAISVVDLGHRGFDVVYHHSLDQAESPLMISAKAQVEREEPLIESITPLTPQADWAEREMAEMYGITFRGHPDLRHLILPPDWPKGPGSGAVQEGAAVGTEGGGEGVRLPRDLMKGKARIPVGVYHPMLIEPVYFALGVDGERITGVDLKPGFAHRGIMKLAEERSYTRDTFLVERVCGICSASHTAAYCKGVEMLGGVEIPDRARYIRTFMCELERIHSHTLWLAIAMDLIGFDSMLMMILRERERVLDMREEISGGRITTGMSKIGGVRRDISGDALAKARASLSLLGDAVASISSAVRSDPLVRRRLEGRGVLAARDAMRLGVVGPVARGSGVPMDVRKSDPYDAYSEVSFGIATRTEGDSLARTEVRLDELAESLSICRQCLDRLEGTAGPIAAEEVPEFDDGAEALSRVEAPRGELLYYIVSNGTNQPALVRIRTPSFMNNTALSTILKGETFADAPLVIGSIDPCLSCTDRIEAVRQGIRSGRA